MTTTEVRIDTEMPSRQKTILLGMHEHEPMLEFMLKRVCSGCNYKPTTVHTSDEFLDEMNKQSYDRYLKEANLGDSNGADLAPAKLSYSLLVSKIGKEEAGKRFLAITGNNDYVEILKSEGIPAMCKSARSSEEIKAFLRD